MVMKKSHNDKKGRVFLNKIKVLNVISDTNIGGAGKCVINYCKNRNKGKFEIIVVMPKDSLLKPEIKATRSKDYRNRWAER